MTSKVKSIALSLSVVLLAVLLLGGRYLWEQANPLDVYESQDAFEEQQASNKITVKPHEDLSPSIESAEWETYTNNAYNWSIKYPNDWNFGEASGNNLRKSIFSR